MYEEKAALFLYCVSPVHMGAGTALGAIDNPIQRERHTDHPMIAGSGLKGAIRHEANALWRDKKEVVRIFGPDPEENNASERAGSLALSDAQIVLFPVRSLRGSYVYATCPTALGRLERLLALAGISTGWSIPAPGREECVVANEQLKTGANLVLEAFQFTAQEGGEAGSGLKAIAAWLSEHALPPDASNEYFRKKVALDTVVLHDDRFNYFVRNATVVEPHVRISDETGTADDGGLFYTENLPPESLLVSLALASREHGKRNGTDEAGRLGAREVLDAVSRGRNGKPGFEGRMVQVGGDATTGRGQVLLRFVRRNGEVSHA